MHDYYDFMLSIEDQSRRIRNEVLNGKYVSSLPLIYRLEKKFGICRHMMIPSPSDALVFQTIVEEIADRLRKKAPSKKAYYARDKHNMRLPHQQDRAGEYPWFIQWKKFLKEIYEFSEEFEYLAITDLSNYYDSIGLRELRHIISSTVQVDEVILDLLFTMIEQLSWVPDYLPTSNRGLPTVDIEAVRLLAHVNLYELDRVLVQHTNSSFVRWMDDINFGVKVKQDAYKIFGKLNDILKSRGMALNLSKTRVYSSEEVKKHFFYDENVYLDQFNRIKKEDTTYSTRVSELNKQYKAHWKNKEFRSWDKITKRFLTTFGKHRLGNLVKDIDKLFTEHPPTRKHCLNYLRSIGPKKNVLKKVKSLIVDHEWLDDSTLFSLCKLITDWKLPMNNEANEFLKEVSDHLSEGSTVIEAYCFLWFSAKYSQPKTIIEFIENNRNLWKNDPFLSRQVISVIPRVLPYKPEKSQKIMLQQIKSGVKDAASVAININTLVKEKLQPRTYSYLFPPNVQNPYPLAKYLILYTTIMNKVLVKRGEFRNKALLRLSDDPWYKHWIEIYL